MTSENNSSSTNIQNNNKNIPANINTGNITGAGIIVGNGIHIDGDFIVQTSKQARSLGLRLLEPNYFRNRTVERDLENWKKGFEFELPDIMAGLEFKREDLLSSIIGKLDGKNDNVGGHTVLLLGKSGTSKSTILKELICHYFKEQYIILYNFGEEKIENVYDIVEFIEDKLNAGKVDNKENKILIAVDNVNDERTASIFSVIDQLDDHIKKDNLRFILTARQPEFDRFIQDRLSNISEEIRKSINKLVNDSDLKFEIGSFDEDEIANFIRKYEGEPEILGFLRQKRLWKIDLYDDKKLKVLVIQIYKETKGHPILVKFSLLGKGLLQDVKKRYDDHLASSETRLVTAIICSILNRTGLPITTTITDCMNLTEYVEELTGSIVTFSEDTNTWKTIHPAWDLAFLTYLLTSSKEISILNKRKRLMTNALDTLLACIQNEDNKYSILGGLYDSTSMETEKTKIPVDLLDTIITHPKVLDKLNDIHKVKLYTLSAARGFVNWQRYGDAIKCYDKAIELDPTYKKAWYEKGKILDNQGNYAQAIVCYNKAIELDSTHADAWWKKGLALYNQGHYDQAIECYDKAIELDPNDKDAWYNKGNSLYDQGHYDQAIGCYNKVISLDPKFKEAWNNKGLALYDQGHYDQAIECYDKAIELDPNDKDAWINKSIVLEKQGQFNEAILCCDKAIELDPTAKESWDSISCTRYKMGDFDKALDAVNKVIEIDPNYANGWFNKSIYLIKKCKIDEALSSLKRAIELDANYAEHAKTNTGFFDDIRNDKRFIELIGES